MREHTGVPKRRLGVVLLIPQPAAAEVDALRRATGGDVEHVPPHITLVPPVNVNNERLPAAYDVARAAAASIHPMRLTLGPPATFLPATPVLYLAVNGDTDLLMQLRDRVFRPPLERAVDHDFVPHVTLADGIETDRITSALVALASVEISVTIRSVHVLEQHGDRLWRPIAEMPLGTPAVVGRGGIAVELVTTAYPDVDARPLLALLPFSILARVNGRAAGVATGYTNGDTARLTELTVAESERGQGVATRLLAAVESLAADRRCTEIEADDHPFFTRYGWVNGRRRLA